MTETTQQQTDEETTNHTFRQTSPRNLAGNSGCDHNGTIKLRFDESTLPEDTNEEVANDLNWCLEAVNAIIHHPNLALWVRTTQKDLVIAHEPENAHSHERAGYMRASSFSASTSQREKLNIDSEIESGLLTPFDTVNSLYDFIVKASYEGGYSLILADIQYLQANNLIDHPIISTDDGVANWGRHQLLNRSLPVTTERDRTAFPEQAYPPHQTEQIYESDHSHAIAAINKHINSFVKA